MSRRSRSILLVSLALASLWLAIVLVLLAQSDNPFKRIPGQSDSAGRPEATGEPLAASLVTPQEARNSVQSASSKGEPHQAHIDQKFRNKPNNVLYYQFINNFNERPELEAGLDRAEHELQTRRLALHHNLTDAFVRDEGFRLFSFNLLVSNRIGAFRPLPDTRHPQCREPVAGPPRPPSRGEARDEAPESSSSMAAESSSNQTRGAREPTNNLTASVIICYFNEAPSALIRTVASVLKRSPRDKLQEILVVDDHSDSSYAADTIRAQLGSCLVRVVRTQRREGLIRARLFGAGQARGRVLVFLDSHVEANVGWLEPLLEAVAAERATLACPMIDLINAETLVYTASPMVRGGLSWALNFKWDSVPSHELRTAADFVKPIRSATMAGGLFAVDKEYFYKMGAYDPRMELWGAENVELSLRIWMCGGRVVIVPCSRLGHIFRKVRPYGPKTGQTESSLLNAHRTARVWLDEQQLEEYFKAVPGARELDSGDISDRVQLKQALGCQNFTWFIDNVYPSMLAAKVAHSSRLLDAGDNVDRPKLFEFKRDRQTNAAWRVQKRQLRQVRLPIDARVDQNLLPDRRPVAADNGVNERQMIFHHSHGADLASRDFVPEAIARFQIRSTNTNLCIESKNTPVKEGYIRLVLNECVPIARGPQEMHRELSRSQANQIWVQTVLNDYRLGADQCLDVLKNLPLLRKCHNMGSFQTWIHEHNKTSETVIYNTTGRLCLGVEKTRIGEPIVVTICDGRIEGVGSSGSFASASAWPPNQRSIDRISLGWLIASSLKSGRQNAYIPLQQPIQEWDILYVNQHSD